MSIWCGTIFICVTCNWHTIIIVVGKSNMCNFAEDNNLNSCGANLKTVLESLTHDARNFFTSLKKFHESKPRKVSAQYSVKDRINLKNFL